MWLDEDRYAQVDASETPSVSTATPRLTFALVGTMTELTPPGGVVWLLDEEWAELSPVEQDGARRYAAARGRKLVIEPSIPAASPPSSGRST